MPLARLLSKLDSRDEGTALRDLKPSSPLGRRGVLGILNRVNNLNWLLFESLVIGEMTIGPFARTETFGIVALAKRKSE